MPGWVPIHLSAVSKDLRLPWAEFPRFQPAPSPTRPDALPLRQPGACLPIVPVGDPGGSWPDYPVGRTGGARGLSVTGLGCSTCWGLGPHGDRPAALVLSILEKHCSSLKNGQALGTGPGGGPLPRWAAPWRPGLLFWKQPAWPVRPFLRPKVGPAAVENSLATPQKTKELPHSPAAPLLGTCQGGGKQEPRGNLLRPQLLPTLRWKSPSPFRGTDGWDLAPVPRNSIQP